MTVNGLIARAPVKIALIAHNDKKQELLDWVDGKKNILSRHCLFATGNTGALITKETGLFVSCFNSGPLGGDQQIGARISEREIDILIFFWDPLHAAPHDHDVKALMRIAVLYNIPCAYNSATADFIFSSPQWSLEKKAVRAPSLSVKPSFQGKLHIISQPN